MAAQLESSPAQSHAPVERSIWIYGNPDKTALGFPMPGDLTQYIKDDVFSKENGRYRYTQGKNADVIVLSRDGLAYGHLDVEDKVKPNEADRRAYPRVRFVYLVRKSTLYKNPVPLSSLSIKQIRYGQRITDADFLHLQQLADGTQEYHNTPPIPQSTAELERVLREVKLRLGQSDFRRRLLAVYNSRCAISGCDAVEALEAAHIKPYSGADSNDPSNGVLLRADLHTLFDLNLIAIDPQHLTIVLGTTLRNTSYSELHGKRLALPDDPANCPNNKALAERWQQFST